MVTDYSFKDLEDAYKILLDIAGRLHPMPKTRIGEATSVPMTTVRVAIRVQARMAKALESETEAARLRVRAWFRARVLGLPDDLPARRITLVPPPFREFTIHRH